MTSQSPIKSVLPLKGPWPCLDPILFCAYHLDAYPKGNAQLGPAESLVGRHLGSDFASVNGWNMYHGDTIPGFPQHPHRGFETVTIARSGFVDHADSLGAAARFGQGDAQWITAGKGLSHSEMFPLLQQGKSNPLDLFQIWLNLPQKNKLVAPYFSIFWDENIPKIKLPSQNGKFAVVTLIAGKLGNVHAPIPPPDSWAARPESDIAIWTIKMEADASLVLPASSARSNRMLYFFRGSALTVGEAGTEVIVRHAIELFPDQEIKIQNGDQPAELLLLQGRPLNEPVAQHGPFVMNTQKELQDAFEEYRRTQFGGWPWGNDAPVHGPAESRFAKYPDGRIEKPKQNI